MPKDPTLALVLTWICPGLGHAYLGRLRRAALCFLGTGLLYAVGLYLSGPAIFSLSGAGSVARSSTSRIWLLILMPLPEILHLGGTLIGAFLLLEPTNLPGSLPSPLTALGVTASALSGMLNLFVMADAWTLAKADAAAAPKEPALAAALSWLVPGAGHLYVGNRFRALFFFASINLLYLGGLLLGQGLVVNREKYFYYWAGQLLNGGLTILCTWLTSGWRVQESVPLLDLGLLYTTVAGLLNVLAILSAYSDTKGVKG